MKEFIERAGWVLPEAVLLIGGVVVFCAWFFRTSFGRKALIQSEPRRNNMPLAVPFVVLAAYFVISPCIFLLIRKRWDIAEMSGQYYLVYNIVTGIIAIISVIVIIVLIRRSFVRGLKGFGFNLRTIFRDFGSALLNLCAIWPIIMAVILLTVEIGKLFYGPDYTIGQHQELKNISAYPQQLPLLISIFLVTVLIGPVLEELLFRGLIQNMVRSLGYGPWSSIAICSGCFVCFHASPSHWPALFILSMGIGYSYERSTPSLTHLTLLQPLLLSNLLNTI
jgi:membrane protease YdiL (CAAX protease family)